MNNVVALKDCDCVKKLGLLIVSTSYHAASRWLLLNQLHWSDVEPEVDRLSRHGTHFSQELRLVPSPVSCRGQRVNI